MKPLHVHITDEFWTHYIDLVATQVLPYQYNVINGQQDVALPLDPGGNPVDTADPRQHTVRNLRVAAGELDAPFHGMLFQDSDVYKWLEAVAYILEQRADEQLQATADEIVDLIARAQQSDGYLDTFFQIKVPERKYARLQQSHELYVMGHYIEAGVAYWQATGNRQALDIAIRMADHIRKHFGDGPDQIHGADGHPEIEIALARLADATGHMEYAELGRWFLTVRGQDPDFYTKQNEADGLERDFFPIIRELPATYSQSDRPVSEQDTAEGHAVRALYLCTGLAYLGRLTGDSDLIASANRLWDNITTKRMYITGAVGSTHVGESFTYDYDLPNDTMYGETCASVAVCFFARQMMMLHPGGQYGDVMERELFNGALAGMSLDGTHFYYVNPLEADAQTHMLSPDTRHVLTHRAGWFACACCPANLARLIASIDHYVYAQPDDHTVIASQFIASRASNDDGITIEQTGDYPWDGTIGWTIANGSDHALRFGVRIPAWSSGAHTLLVDGFPNTTAPKDGIAYVTVDAHSDMTVTLELPMDAKLVRASNRVKETVGQVALMRGPIVYCAESCDNPGPLWLYTVNPGEAASAEYDEGLLGGVTVVRQPAWRQPEDPETQPLYVPATPRPREACEVTMVPYYTWANRDEGQMRVWLPCAPCEADTNR